MNKKVLVTAGSTMIRIDQVRVISNIFKGSTGTQIAAYFQSQGDEVTLITSNPKLASALQVSKVETYCTFDELADLMESAITGGKYDVIIHSAAVSDYKTAGVFTREDNDRELVSLDASTKISSEHEELFLKLVPTPKLIDQIRQPWGFQGLLVKFKLQVGLPDDWALIDIARRSLDFSKADLIVANCLEWAREYAYFIDKHNNVKRTSRDDLAAELYRRTR
ncbi:MAG: bifunctional phosphopantothenoylcysteine decarboxylase/phosphopantothenate synthase [Candidatus Parcubacteria bacterium]|nr:bifunctional phosphopantothenoylcysteine decarboxylase/phosphopantothenate synthase [Candidatus Parcubacteria bacterium]